MQNNDIANLRTTQRINRLRVLNMVRFSDGISRLAVAKATGLSAAAMTNIVSYLIKAELVEETGVEQVDRIGRKGRLLSFRGDSYRFISISLNSAAAKLYLTDLSGTVHTTLERDIARQSPPKVIDALHEGIISLMATVPMGKLLAVGVSISGMVLEDGNCVVSASLNWDMVNLKGMLAKGLGVPIIVSNTTFTKATWLCRGIPPAQEGNIIFFEMDQGMGGALIQNGTVDRKTALEIGHTAVELDGEPCFCGNWGCLEVSASPQRTLERYEEASGKKITSLSELSRLIKVGDPSAIKAGDTCARYLGVALANIVNLFSPRYIIINDADFIQCPDIFKQAEEVLHSRALNGLTRSLTLEHKHFEPADLPKSLAYELCGMIFAEIFHINIFDMIERNL